MKKIIEYVSGDNWFAIAIFGKGITVRNSDKLPLLFSERAGYTKFWKIGKWVIKCI